MFRDSLKIQEAQDKQEQPFTGGEKVESPEGREVEERKERSEARDSALPRGEMERLQLCESLEESRRRLSSLAKERDDLQRLQGTLQAERDQLTERVRELSAKVGSSFSLFQDIFEQCFHEIKFLPKVGYNVLIMFL